MIDNFQQITGSILLWIINHVGLRLGLIFKDSISDVAACIVGFAIASMFFAFILKDTRIVSDELATRIFITKIKKNHHEKVFVTVPNKINGCLSTVTMLAIFIHVVIVKLSPIKQLQFVDKMSIRLCICFVLFLILIFFIVSLSIDFHIILPANHGGYYIEY